MKEVTLRPMLAHAAKCCLVCLDFQKYARGLGLAPQEPPRIYPYGPTADFLRFSKGNLLSTLGLPPEKMQ